MTEFNETSKKIIELKNKIQNEMNKINNLFEKTIDDLTKVYLKKHEQLLKEENDLKEKLQNEVTKIKEQLEIFYSQANNEIKISERINKGIKKIQNEEKNIIRNIAYISKITKTYKKMKELLEKSMKNISFSYLEEKNCINYNEYYFNMILKPINIEFKNITSSSFNLTWKFDNENTMNIDNNKITNIVEIRKENENFKKVYEGNNNNCLINNLNPNTFYEIRICSIYESFISEWSQIQKISTTKLDIYSIILNESNKKNKLLMKLKEWIGNKKFELIYRGTRDGMNHQVYHNKCDNKGENIILIENEKKNIFGGYASKSWNVSHLKYQNDPDSFLFSLTNIYNTEPIKFPIKDSKNALFYRTDFGPLFGNKGNDLGLHKDFLNEGGFCISFNAYSDILGKKGSVFTGENNSSNFKVKEIEVFKLV